MKVQFKKSNWIWIIADPIPRLAVSRIPGSANPQYCHEQKALFSSQNVFIAFHAIIFTFRTLIFFYYPYTT
jgi:hypothetical protein